MKKYYLIVGLFLLLISCEGEKGGDAPTNQRELDGQQGGGMS